CGALGRSNTKQLFLKYHIRPDDGLCVEQQRWVLIQLGQGSVQYVPWALRHPSSARAGSESLKAPSDWRAP
ncbi:hypothetical protein EMPG_15898, partial [Blastomyces silverae]